MKLKGKKVAILIAPRGTEDSEFTQPRDAVRKEGADVTVIGLEKEDAETTKGDLDPAGKHKVDTTFGDVSPDDFDALIIPGGSVGSDKLRGESQAVEFVQGFFQREKPVAVICHGPWLLVEAGVAKGRKLTSYSSIKTDIRNAGGNWVDEEVAVDRGLITSRSPDDLPAFIEKLVEEFAA